MDALLWITVISVQDVKIIRDVILMVGNAEQVCEP